MVVQSQPQYAVNTRVYRPTGDYNLTFSVVLTVICCVCGGWWSLLCTVPAIVIASAARNDDAAGNISAARSKGNIALALNIFAIVLYIIAAIIVIASAVASTTTAFSVVSSIYYCQYCSHDIIGTNFCYYSYSYAPASTYEVITGYSYYCY